MKIINKAPVIMKSYIEKYFTGPSTLYFKG